VGLAVQDRKCEQGCTVLTGGEYDATWVTIVTDYALAVADVTMAVMAPGEGLTRYSIVIACLLDGIGWFCAGILHHFFYMNSAIHDVLWSISLITGSLAALGRVYAAAVGAKAAGNANACRAQPYLGASPEYLVPCSSLPYPWH